MNDSVDSEDVASTVPVTALSSVFGLLIVGCGSTLHFYDEEHVRFSGSCSIFTAQQIHGIAVHPTNDSTAFLLVWGGRFIRVVRIALSSDEQHQYGTTLLHFSKSKIGRLSDWILDATFKSSNDATLAFPDTIDNETELDAALVTAHNAILILRLNQATTGSGTAFDLNIESVVPGSRSISYSAHILWETPTELLLAVGSAFGEVNFSEYHVLGSDAQLSYFTSHLGHEGSVFGIRISAPLQGISEGVPTRLLVSCSDDRTIRLWNPKVTSVATRDLIAPKTLGSKSSDSNVPDVHLNELSRSTSIVAAVMGHSSRIWNVHFLHHRLPNSNSTTGAEIDDLGLVSVGEDATCQIWALSRGKMRDICSGEHPRYGLYHRHTVKLHQGKNIWSSTIVASGDAQNPHRVITGGADGGIMSYSIKRGILGQPQEMLDSRNGVWTFEDILVKINAKQERQHMQTVLPGKIDSFRAYALLGQGKVAVSTHSGSVFTSTPLLTNENGLVESREWNLLDRIAGLRGYSVADGVPDRDIALFGDATGGVHLVDGLRETTKELGRVGAKIGAIFARNLTGMGRRYVSVLVSPLGKHDLHLFLLFETELGWQLEHSRRLTTPTGQATSVVTSSACFMRDSTVYYALGTRSGSLLFGDLQLASSAVDASILIAQQTTKSVIEDAHGHEAVTGIHWISPAESENQAYVFSTGRDGVLTVHLLDLVTFEAQMRHGLTWPYGHSIEKLYVRQETAEVFLIGFAGRNFVVYNLSTATEIFSIECGGSHRTWAFDLTFARGIASVKATLVWTQKASCNIHILNESPVRTFRNSGHGREVKTTAAVGQRINTGAAVSLLATGAEDTDIRLFSCNGRSTLNDDMNDIPFHCQATIRKHMTGVQHLYWSTDGQYLFSSGGCEEFYVWRMSQIPCMGVGVVCESRCPLESVDSDLRITSFAVHEVWPKHTTSSTTDGATRDDVTFLIALTYSNSVIQIYTYSSSPTNGGWRAFAAAEYTNACFTQAAYNSFGEHLCLFTAGTDGNLTIWSLPTIELALGGTSLLASHEQERLRRLKTLKLHQSAVKTLSICNIADGRVLVMSGGDDNALSFAILGQTHDSVAATTVHTVRDAHVASITGSWLARCQSPGLGTDTCKFNMIAVTSSNDQRLSVWDIQIDDESLNNPCFTVRKRKKEHTTVADGSSVTVLPSSTDAEGSDFVVVSGVGLGLHRLRRRSQSKAGHD